MQVGTSRAHVEMLNPSSNPPQDVFLSAFRSPTRDMPSPPLPAHSQDTSWTDAEEEDEASASSSVAKLESGTNESCNRTEAPDNSIPPASYHTDPLVPRRFLSSSGSPSAGSDHLDRTLNSMRADEDNSRMLGMKHETGPLRTSKNQHNESSTIQWTGGGGNALLVEEEKNSKEKDGPSFASAFTPSYQEPSAAVLYSACMSTECCDPSALAAEGSHHNCGRYHIHPTEYTDRSRLLYHITQLATQLQRAQLMWQEQHSTLVLLHGRLMLLQERQQQQKEEGDPYSSPSPSSPATTNEDVTNPAEDYGRGGTAANPLASLSHTSTTPVSPPSSFTAAALAAKDERELQRAVEQRLPFFDPLLAQTQIQRLDNALAHLSLLREAEMRRAETAENALEELREVHQSLTTRLDALASENEALTQKNAAQESQLAHYALEVERLRMEEARLNRRVAELQRFNNAIQLHSPSNDPSPVRIVGTATEDGHRRPVTHSRTLSRDLGNLPAVLCKSNDIANLEREEQAARQAIWLTMFWEPMAMAFDAGLTWLRNVEGDVVKVLELEELRRELQADSAALPEYQVSGVERRKTSIATSIVSLESKTLKTEVQGKELIPGRSGSYDPFSGGIHHAALSSPHTSARLVRQENWKSADTELLLLRHQEAELQETRIRLEQAQVRQRTLELEMERFRTLYENEKQRATKMANDHITQLKMAYQEIKKDREIIKATLKRDVEQQIRAAFSEGRLFEQQEQHKTNSKAPSRTRRALPKKA